MKTNDVAGVECPLCSFSTHKIGISSRDGLERMAHALQTELPKDLDKNLHESEVLHCDSCGFEFAYPMRDPDALFYKWLTDYGFPYPARRWEWEACANLLEKKAKEGFSTPLTVLDFGSGDGKFLRRLKSIPGVYAVGMDHNPDMIQKCRDMGLDVIESNLNIETFKQKFSQGVYMATFWHVVEHVADPVGLLRDAKKLLTPDGCLCFSVPLSPMSHEYSWPDPFNLPPHHLSRWNIQSLDALAKKLGMKIDIQLPDADSLAFRVGHALLLQAAPPFGKTSRWKKLAGLAKLLLLKPETLFREIHLQRKRPKFKGRTLPDVVLVTLSN